MGDVAGSMLAVLMGEVLKIRQTRSVETEIPEFLELGT